jgi:predicted Zn-dependent protease
VTRSILFLAVLAAGLQAQPADPEALAAAGHFLRLKALIEPRVKVHPEDAKAAYLLAQAEGALGNLDTALKLAETAVALEPANADYHAQIAAQCGRIAQSAPLFKQIAYGRRAKKELDAALELDGNCQGALYGLALFYQAAPSLLGGDRLKAQASADKLIQLNPPRGYLTQAKLASERKDTAAELEFYRKALAADPNNYEASVKLANFYLTRDVKAAWTLASRALAIDPGQADAWKVLAQVDIANQCWDELRALLVRARAAVPDDLAPYYYAALALEQSSNHLAWAADFLNLYKSVPPEGNEPTHADAEKAIKRVASLALRAESR